MKTPRETLLTQHRTAEPKLDAIRRTVLAEELNNQVIKEPRGRRTDTVGAHFRAAFVTWLLRCSNTLWSELVLPSRRVWSGLAAVWFLIATFNLLQGSHFPSATRRPSSSEEMASFRDQQKLLNELLADRSLPVEADRPKTYSPKPRTEAVKLVNL